MSNTKQCSECDHYDPILRGMNETSSGWCVKRSLYPHMDSKGQVTPANAERVPNPTDPAKPYIVARTQVKADCTLYAIKKKRQSKKELMALAMKAR